MLRKIRSIASLRQKFSNYAKLGVVPAFSATLNYSCGRHTVGSDSLELNDSLSNSENSNKDNPNILSTNLKKYNLNKDNSSILKNKNAVNSTPVNISPIGSLEKPFNTKNISTTSTNKLPQSSLNVTNNNTKTNKSTSDNKKFEKFADTKTFVPTSGKTVVQPVDPKTPVNTSNKIVEKSADTKTSSPLSRIKDVKPVDKGAFVPTLSKTDVKPVDAENFVPTSSKRVEKVVNIEPPVRASNKTEMKFGNHVSGEATASNNTDTSAFIDAFKTVMSQPAQQKTTNDVSMRTEVAPLVKTSTETKTVTFVSKEEKVYPEITTSKEKKTVTTVITKKEVPEVKNLQEKQKDTSASSNKEVLDVKKAENATKSVNNTPNIATRTEDKVSNLESKNSAKEAIVVDEMLNSAKKVKQNSQNEDKLEAKKSFSLATNAKDSGIDKGVLETIVADHVDKTNQTPKKPEEAPKTNEAINDNDFSFSVIQETSTKKNDPNQYKIDAIKELFTSLDENAISEFVNNDKVLKKRNLYQGDQDVIDRLVDYSKTGGKLLVHAKIKLKDGENNAEDNYSSSEQHVALLYIKNQYSIKSRYEPNPATYVFINCKVLLSENGKLKWSDSGPALLKFEFNEGQLFERLKSLSKGS